MVERKLEDRGCRSPKHEPGCPCTMCNKAKEVCSHCGQLNVQHEIPESIGHKVLGMSSKQLNEHTHKESKVCHRVNDARVPQVLYEMKKEYNQGVRFSATAVLKMREVGYFRG